MDIDQLHLSAAISGFSFNIEEKVMLQSSLSILKQDYKLQNIAVWGKILGTQRDYIIAQGQKLDADASQHIFFFSLDSGLSWGQLPQPSADQMKKANSMLKRFLGDPGFVYRSQDNEDADMMTEEIRLSATIANINSGCSVVPNGSFYVDHKKKVRKNPLFSGISHQEAGLAKSYVHLSGASIADDMPNGSWAIKKDATGRFVVIQSVHWPGFVSFHMPSTSQFGYLYIGTGKKNHDVGYML